MKPYDETQLQILDIGLFDAKQAIVSVHEALCVQVHF